MVPQSLEQPVCFGRPIVDPRVGGYGRRNDRRQQRHGTHLQAMHVRSIHGDRRVIDGSSVDEGSARRAGHAPQVPTGRARAHEGRVARGQLGHPGAVAEDRAAGAPAARVDGDDRDALAPLDEPAAHRGDEGRG